MLKLWLAASGTNKAIPHSSVLNPCYLNLTPVTLLVFFYRELVPIIKS